MKNFLLSLVAVAVLTGCSSLVMRDQLDKTLEAYNQSVRWREWGNASLFTTDALREEYEKRAAAAKDMRVVDYRVVGEMYDEKKGEATVQMEIDYYNVHSQLVNTLHDTQKWVYIEEHGTKGWRLVSPLPEFR